MPPPDSVSTPAQFNLRAGYRLTYGGSVTAHGLNVQPGVTFRLHPNVRLVLQMETNFMFAASDKPASSLTTDAVLGSHFAGIRGSRFDGTTYTDVTGGSAVANQAFVFETIPETQLLFRPVASFPFELGVRFGFGINYTQLHTTTTVSAADPTHGHTDPGGCIPGDIHCGDAPIPEPTAGSGYGPFETDAGAWTWYVRFGPRIAFPVNDYFQAGSEFLFRSNASGGFDELWRTDVRLGIPIGAHFLLVAQPRYIMSIVQDKGVQHGFDLIAGAQARW